MNRRIQHLESPFTREKLSLELSLSSLAAEIDKQCPPDVLVEVVSNIPLANNYSNPLRVGVFGENYDLLDIEAKYMGLSDSEAHLEGARLTFKRYGQAGSTVVELMAHKPDTELAKVPFCITPSGCEKPLNTTTFEDVVYLLNDLVQKKSGDSTALFDPREEEPIDLAQAFHMVTAAVSEGAEKRITQRTHELSAPIITSIGDVPNILERTIGVNLQRSNGKLDFVTLFIDGSHDIGGGVVKQRLAFSHGVKEGLSEVLSYTASTDAPVAKIETEFADTENNEIIINIFQTAILDLAKEKLTA